MTEVTLSSKGPDGLTVSHSADIFDPDGLEWFLRKSVREQVPSVLDVYIVTGEPTLSE